MSGARLKRGLLLAALLGIALVCGLVVWVGWRGVVHAAATMGLPGFLTFCASWLLVVLVLGLAWAAAAPGAGASRLGAFLWGRLLREAASDVLPFSQIGGLVLGARGVVRAGVREDLVYASTLVDVTAELIAQIFYTVLGLALTVALLSGALEGRTLWAALGGLVLLLAVSALVLTAQRGAVRWLGRVAARWLPTSIARADAVTEALDAIYARSGRVALAIVLHVAGWVGSSVVSWLALQLMGVDIPFWGVIAIESLMFAVRNVGFALPASLGVQEGAYIVIGPLLGLHASEALALSLLKRARDILIGAPVILVWQVMEGRSWLRRREPLSPAPSPDA